jgi:hypothetical protein
MCPAPRSQPLLPLILCAAFALAACGKSIPGNFETDPPKILSISPARGVYNGGTPLSIDGTGFQKTTQITVGGKPCEAIQFVSSLQLGCRTQAHPASTVDVVATNLDGRSDSALASFTYAPVSIAVNDLSGPIQPAQVLTLSWLVSATNAEASEHFNVEYFNGSEWKSIGTVPAAAGPLTNQLFSTPWTVPNLSIPNAQIRVTYVDGDHQEVSQTGATFVVDGSDSTVSKAARKKKVLSAKRPKTRRERSRAPASRR